MHPRFALWALATVVVASACGDDKNTTAGSSDTGVDTTEPTGGPTVGMSSEPTTTVGAEGTADGTAGMTGDGMTSTTTTATTTEPDPTTTGPNPTTGGGEPGIVSGCEDLCARTVECMVMRDLAECVTQCSDGFADAQGQCKKITQDFLGCTAEMTCEQLTALFIEEDPGPCAEQQAELLEKCEGGDICGVSVGGNPEGTECSVQVECEDAPLLAMNCDTDTCTCLEAGMMVGMCPADGVCMDGSDITQKSAQCCGF